MKWILFTDQKPIEREWCLVSDGDNVGVAQYYMYSDGFFVCDNEIPATHWMSLPDSPNLIKRLKKK